VARPLRIEYKNAFYHVIQRGLERRNIFSQHEDSAKFLYYLDNAFVRYNAIFHTYTLMSNHYHMILQTPRANLSQIMHFLNGSYAFYYNFKHKRTGPLYQGRFKDFLIEEDEYLHHLSRYIHLNPVRAGIASSPDQYIWSSYRYFTQNIVPPRYLNVDLILSKFNNNLTKAKRLYKQFVCDVLEEKKKAIEENTRKGIVVGSEEFLKHIQNRVINKSDNTECPVLKLLKERNVPTLEMINQLVTKNIKNDYRLRRKISIYLSRKYSQKKLSEIASFHGKIGYAGVSQVYRRLEQNRKRKAKLNGLIKAIEKQLC